MATPGLNAEIDLIKLLLVRTLQPMFTKIVQVWLKTPSHCTPKAEIKMCGLEDLCTESYGD